MRNKVFINTFPQGMKFRDLDAGDLFRFPTGQEGNVYMRLAAKFDNNAVALSTGVTYTIDAGHIVEPVKSVTVTGE